MRNQAKNCIICQIEFQPHDPRAVTCGSQECMTTRRNQRSAAYRAVRAKPLQKRECEQCKALFLPSTNCGKYCSSECRKVVSNNKSRIRGWVRSEKSRQRNVEAQRQRRETLRLTNGPMVIPAKQCRICDQEFHPHPRGQHRTVCFAQSCGTAWNQQQRRTHWDRDKARLRALKPAKEPLERKCLMCPTLFLVGGPKDLKQLCDDPECRRAYNRDRRRESYQQANPAKRARIGRGATQPHPKPQNAVKRTTAPKKPVVETKPEPLPIPKATYFNYRPAPTTKPMLSEQPKMARIEKGKFVFGTAWEWNGG